MKDREIADQRILLGDALRLAEAIANTMRRVDGVLDVLPAGSLRRRRATVGDIDILINSRTAKAVVDAFVGLPIVRDVLAAGDTKASVRVNGGLQVDCRVVAPESFGAAAQYFTGSKAHNVRLRELAISKGLKLNEYGVFRGDEPIAGAAEPEVYKALGLSWVPPELRENRGEVEAALEGALPSLVDLSDIRGDLHVHTTYSDGRGSVGDMARAAQALGYKYLGISDHSQSLKIAGGLTPQRLRKQRKEIDALNQRLGGFVVLACCEVDILADGSLDLPDAMLGELDFVTASIHTAMQQPRRMLTRRIIAAMRHPCVNAIAHPTGRVFGHRDAYELDFDDVFRVAADEGVALEINSYYERLDLDDVHARAARDAGVKLVINTDSHAPDQLGMMRLGVATARRAWVRPADVINTLSPAKLLAWAKRRAKG